MAETVGQAYIEIIPTTKGIGSAIEAELAGVGERAGKGIGGSIGGALSSVAGGAAGAAAKGISLAANAAMDFGKSSIEAGRSFDAAMGQVAATSGKSMEELSEAVGTADTAYGSFEGNLRDFAQFLGSNTKFSSTEAAEGLNYMALAGYDVQKSMDMLPSVLDLAAAGAMDLGAASDMVTDASSALGLSTQETALMVDQMAKASASSNTSVAQLGDAMLKIGATAAGVKGGTNELSTALGILADSGMKGAEGGTHLRNMLTAIEQPGDKASNALERLGLNSDFAYDSMGKLRGMDEIFGDLSRAMEGMTDQEKDAAIGAIFNKYDLAAANTMLAAVGEGSAQSADLAGKGASRWEELAGAISDSKDAASQMADTQLDNLEGSITQFGAALEGAQIAVSDMLSPALKELVDFGTSGLSGLTKAFNDGGLDAVVEAFGGLVGDALSKVTDALPLVVEKAGLLLESLGQAIGENAPKIFDTIAGLLTDIMEKLAGAAPEAAKGIGGMLSKLVGTITEHAPDFIKAASELVKGLAEGISQSMPTLIPQVVGLVAELAIGLLENVDLLIEAAISLITALAEGLVQALPVLIEKAPEIIQKLVEALIAAVPALVSAATEVVVTLQKGIIDNVPMLVKAAFDIVGSLAGGIVMAIPALLAAAGDMLAQFAGAILDTVKKAPEWGMDLIKGFIDGLKAMVDKLIGTVKDIAGKIADYLGFSEPELGPLSNFHTYAPDMMQLFAKGIRDNARLIEDEIGRSFDIGGMIDTGAVYDAAYSSPVYKGAAIERPASDDGGLYELMARYLPEIARGGNVNVSLEGDAGRLFSVMRKQNNVFYRANGRSAFA